MGMNPPTRDETNQRNQGMFKTLQRCDIEAIDQALKEIGLFGEVHLVVESGRLRFIRTVRSEPIIRTPEVSGKIVGNP